MPRLTERQEDANTLLNAFIVHLLAQMEADAFRGADSESDSEAGTSDGEDSEDYSSDDPITEGIIKSLEELYKDRYAGPRRDIPKTQENLRLLLDNYHKNFPNIFRSYTRVTPGSLCAAFLVATFVVAGVAEIFFPFFAFALASLAFSTMSCALRIDAGDGGGESVICRVNYKIIRQKRKKRVEMRV